jgi:hypothetical protein
VLAAGLRFVAPSLLRLESAVATRAQITEFKLQPITEGEVCHGCQRQISKRITVLASRSHEAFQCERYGRLIFARTSAPDYVT